MFNVVFNSDHLRQPSPSAKLPHVSVRRTDERISVNHKPAKYYSSRIKESDKWPHLKIKLRYVPVLLWIIKSQYLDIVKYGSILTPSNIVKYGSRPDPVVVAVALADGALQGTPCSTTHPKPCHRLSANESQLQSVVPFGMIYGELLEMEMLGRNFLLIHCLYSCFQTLLYPCLLFFFSNQWFYFEMFFFFILSTLYVTLHKRGLYSPLIDG